MSLGLSDQKKTERMVGSKDTECRYQVKRGQSSRQREISKGEKDRDHFSTEGHEEIINFIQYKNGTRVI